MKNMSYEIEYLPFAMQDLEDIADYLSRFYSGTFKKFMNVFEKHLSSLRDMLYIGIEYGDYRKFVVSDYHIFYKVIVEKNLIQVYRILHGARDTEIKRMG